MTRRIAIWLLDLAEDCSTALKLLLAILLIILYCALDDAPGQTAVPNIAGLYLAIPQLKPCLLCCDPRNCR